MGKNSTSLKSSVAENEAAVEIENDDNEDYENEDEDDEGEGDDDDSQSFHIASAKSNEDYIMSKQQQQSSSFSHQLNSSLKLKQITKMISPKWPNRVFAFELIRRIIVLCDIEQQKNVVVTAAVNNNNNNNNNYNNSVANEDEDDDERQLESKEKNNLKKLAHFDLKLAKKLKSTSPSSNQEIGQEEDDYLILFLQDLMRIACIGATSSCDPLKLVGLDLLNDLILAFAHVEEPNAEFKGHLVLEQYQVKDILIYKT